MCSAFVRAKLNWKSWPVPVNMFQTTRSSFSFLPGYCFSCFSCDVLSSKTGGSAVMDFWALQAKLFVVSFIFYQLGSWCDWFYMFIAKVIISLFYRWFIAPDVKPASTGLWGSSCFQSWRTQSMLNQLFGLFFWKSRAFQRVMSKASMDYVSLTASVNINASNTLPGSWAHSATFKDTLQAVLGLRLGVGKLCSVWGFVNLAKPASGSWSLLANLGKKKCISPPFEIILFSSKEHSLWKNKHIFLPQGKQNTSQSSQQHK